jgi:hypothetical protein
MAVIATCHARFGRAERDDRVVRRLTARGEAEALALLRYAGKQAVTIRSFRQRVR